MLVVFEFGSASDLAHYLGVVTWKNDVQIEDLEYCISREKAQEILLCRDLKIPYVVLAKSHGFSVGPEDVSIVDSNIDVCLLDPATPLIFRTSSRSIDHPALEHFPFYVPTVQSLDVDHWVSHIRNPEKYLKRQVVELSRDDFNQAMRDGSIPTPIFIKGVDKGSALSLHHVIANDQELRELIKSGAELRKLFGARVPSELQDDEYAAFIKMPDWFCPFRETLEAGRINFYDPRSGVMLSDVLEFKHQPDHKAEYRCFIVDGKVTSVSAYADYHHFPVPPEVREFAQAFAADHADLAPAFVADVGVTDRGIILIELNDITYSGRYVGNDAYALYRAFEDQLGINRDAVRDPIVQIPSSAEAMDSDEDELDGELIERARSKLLTSDKVGKRPQSPDDDPGFIVI